MNMLEEHALLERPSGNPECLDRIITLQPTDQPSSHQSPIHHTMCQHITRGYTVPFMDVDFTVLAIDPGTSQMGWALIQWKGYKPQIRRAGTVKGAGIFADVFGHWQQQTNSHERDAALMGHWWGSVLLKNRKPMWCFGISEAQVKP